MLNLIMITTVTNENLCLGHIEKYLVPKVGMHYKDVVISHNYVVADMIINIISINLVASVDLLNSERAR